MKYNTILFDADGTILDFSKSEENALHFALKNQGIELTKEILNDYKEINESLWKEFELGKISKEELVNIRFERLFNKYQLSVNPIKFNLEYLDHLKEGGYIIENADIVLEKLSKDCSLYIVTNGINKIQESRLNKSGLKKYFKEVFVSELIGFQKPKIEFFDYVFKTIPNIDLSKTIIIGDSLTSDIIGGNNAKIDTIWYNPQHLINNTKAEVNYEIKDLLELYNIIY